VQGLLVCAGLKPGCLGSITVTTWVEQCHHLFSRLSGAQHMASASLSTQQADRRPHGIRPVVARMGGRDWGERALQQTWRSLGAIFFGIGVINAFLPVMPTTVFLLLGLWAYGKGDPRMRNRLLAHPRFGPTLRLWVERRQISRKGKLAAIGGIASGAAITAVMLGPRPLLWGVLGGLAALSLYLATRAEPTAA